MKSDIQNRRDKFIARLAAGMTPNAAAKGLGLNATREMTRGDVQAALIYKRVDLEAKKSRPEPAPTPAASPKPMLGRCDRCKREFKPGWARRLVNQHTLCAG